MKARAFQPYWAAVPDVAEHNQRESPLVSTEELRGESMIARALRQGQERKCRFERRLLGPILLMIALIVDPGGSTLGATSPDLECSKVRATADQLELKCTLKNAGNQDIFVSTGKPVLEGPEENEPLGEYFYTYIYGGRYENVLQFNRAGVDLNSIPSPFHGAADPTLEEIKSMRRLPGGRELNILVSWQLAADKNFLAGGDWVVLLKLIFITYESIADILAGDTLYEPCANILRVARDSATRRSTLQLSADRGSGPNHSYANCEGRIAWGFEHVASNQIQVSFP